MMTLNHRFVEFIPEELEEGLLYISIQYKTAAHLCACGCKNAVITPIKPTDWKLVFNGESVSLFPSIGNWNFDCKSHYWIRSDQIRWAQRWSEEWIEANREVDKISKAVYFKSRRDKS